MLRLRASANAKLDGRTLASTSVSLSMAGSERM